MELIKQHILPQLNSFTNEIPSSIDHIFSEIQNDSKTEFTEIICYIEHLLNLCFLSTNQGLTSLHIHIENEFDDNQKLLLAEFLSIKLFKYYAEEDQNLQYDESEILKNLINQLESQTSADLYFPMGLTRAQQNQIWNRRRS